MNLYINLFKEIDSTQSSSIIDNKADNYYLDFQGNHSGNDSIKNIVIEEFDDYPSIYNKAVKEYTSFVSELSTINIGNKHIRSFRFKELPLFWLTGISEKHYYHWLMKAMLIKELLAAHPKFFKTYAEIIIIIPQRYQSAELLIKDSFLHQNIEPKFKILTSNSAVNPYFNLFKIYIKTIWSFLKMKKPLLTKEQNLVTFLITGKPTGYTEEFFNNIIEITKQKKGEISLIPLYCWINNTIKLGFKVPSLFWRTKPTVLKLSFIFLQQLKVLRAVKRAQITQIINVNNINFPISLLTKELESVIINKNNALIMAYWLSSYKKQLNSHSKFFYEDEFYPYGRAISFGLKNQKTFGIQHSMIPKNHTVYHISDKEIKSSHNQLNDGLPLPFQFIVWGDYFKYQFLANNTLQSDFVYSAGNPTYIKRASEKQKTTLQKKGVTVLYCLTTPEIFSREKNIIKDTLKNIPQLTLNIRFHPLWSFDKQIITDFFNSINVTFSQEKNIFNDISNSTFVMVGSHSGVWLDAIISNKFVIRLITSFYDEIEQNDMMHNATSCQEMKHAIQFALKENKNDLKNDLLYLKNDRWKNLFLN